MSIRLYAWVWELNNKIFSIAYVFGENGDDFGWYRQQITINVIWSPRLVHILYTWNLFVTGRSVQSHYYIHFLLPLIRLQIRREREVTIKCIDHATYVTRSLCVFAVSHFQDKVDCEIIWRDIRHSNASTRRQTSLFKLCVQVIWVCLF